MQNQNILFFMILAIIAGILVTIQGPVNVALGKSLGNDYWAAFSTFIVGAIAIGIFLIVTKQEMPPLTSFVKIAPWKYLGSLFGAFFVIGIIFIVPNLGIGLTTLILLFSQIATAMVLDHFGLFGYTPKPFDLTRLSGTILMILGIYLINRK